MQQIKNIVKGPYEPQDNTVVWIDTSNPDAPIAKVHSNGEWRQQIAQQDHLKIVGKSSNDAELYAGLAKAKENGTIFDTTIEIMSGDYTSISRPLEIVNPDTMVVIYSFGEMEELTIANSPQYYEVLALVQQGGYGYDSFPVLEYTDWPDETTHVLYESNTGAYGICNGKCVVITFDDESIITSAEISNIDSEPGEPTFEINEGDLDKLIGFMLG